jgi:PPM family protein phosphatase
MKNGEVTFHAAGIADKGRISSNKEGNFYSVEDRGLFIVSDGIGGGAAGEKASEFVVRSLPLLLKPLRLPCPEMLYEEVAEEFRQAIIKVSSELRALSLQSSEYKNAGATFVACQILGHRALVTHLGDSRAYRLHKGFFERLTADHSVVETLYRAGKIDKKHMKSHPARGVITHYIGMAGEVRPELKIVPIEEGDSILLCSDSLSGMISDRAIGTILMDDLSLSDKLERLIMRVNLAGGKDNITALLIGAGDCRPGVKTCHTLKIKRAVFS